MYNLIELWCKNLETDWSGAIGTNLEAWGECKWHTGPSVLFAKVRISLGPSDGLEVVDKLPPDKSARLKQEGWYDYVIFGVLDVMLTGAPIPYRTFKLTLLDVEVDEITARKIAFRLAARDAARKILAQLT